MLGWFLPYISVKRPYILMGLPGGAAGKESTCNVGDLGSIPGLKRSPGRRRGSALQDSCLENPHGQSSLVSCSPLGHNESDTTEQLSQSKNREIKERKIRPSEM